MLVVVLIEAKTVLDRYQDLVDVVWRWTKWIIAGKNWQEFLR